MMGYSNSQRGGRLALCGDISVVTLRKDHVDVRRISVQMEEPAKVLRQVCDYDNEAQQRGHHS